MSRSDLSKRQTGPFGQLLLMKNLRSAGWMLVALLAAAGVTFDAAGCLASFCGAG